MKDWTTTLITPDRTIRDAIVVLEASAAQICLIVNDDRRLLGTLTDGDLRRSILRSIGLDEPVSQVVHGNPHTVRDGLSRAALLEMMQRNDVRHLPVVDGAHCVIGLVLLEDLVAVREPARNWVVLMAGGAGRRLRPLTEETPKPMLPVGGRPLLETIIESFVNQDFHRFYLAVNYRAEQIKEHFGDGAEWGAEIRYLHEQTALGTAGALAMIEETPSEPFLVMNADLLTSVNFKALMGFHHEQRSQATMCVREFDMQVPYGVVNIDGQQIISIDEKPVHRFLVNAGIYVFEPEMLSLVPRGAPLDIPEMFEKIVAEGHTTAVFPIREYWLDVGRPDEYHLANGDIAKLSR